MIQRRLLLCTIPVCTDMGGLRRPHLRSLQRSPAHRLRAQQPGRTRPQRRKFLSDQRRPQLRQPHRTLRLLRQPQRQPQQSRHPDARPPGRSRRRQRLRRLRLADFQRRPVQPTPPRNVAAQGLLPNSLRPLPQRHRERADRGQWICGAVSQPRPSRRRPRIRCHRQLLLGPHVQFKTPADGLPVLPLQRRRLRQRRH